MKNIVIGNARIVLAGAPVLEAVVHRVVNIPSAREEVLLFLGTQACVKINDKWLDERSRWRNLFSISHAREGCRDGIVVTKVNHSDPICSTIKCEVCGESWRTGDVDKMSSAQIGKIFVTHVRPGNDSKIPVKLVVEDGHTVERGMTQQEVDAYNAGEMLEWRRKHSRYI